MEAIKTAHQTRIQQITDLAEQIQKHKEQVDAMSKDDADMGGGRDGGSAAVRAMASAAPIAPDPIAGFVENARTILQGSTTPNEAQ